MNDELQGLDARFCNWVIFEASITRSNLLCDDLEGLLLSEMKIY